jgi:hypothetical protein
MHLIAGWSILSVLSVVTVLMATQADSRVRCIVNWVILPVLLEGVVLNCLYLNLR